MILCTILDEKYFSDEFFHNSSRGLVFRTDLVANMKTIASLLLLSRLQRLNFASIETFSDFLVVFTVQQGSMYVLT